MSSLISEGHSEAAPVADTSLEFGVLFVAGFAEQRPGEAIAALAGALYRWLFRWNTRSHWGSAAPPTLSETALSSSPGADGEPAHVRLTVPVQLSTGERDVNWLLAESSWAGLFRPPRFLGVARWIWKVSTCLLVLQFIIPMQRHWHRAKRPGKPEYRRIADRFMALCYLIFMAVAAMASVLLSLVLLALAIVEKLPIPRIELAVRWVAVKVSAVLGDSYMLAHCPVQFAAMRTQVARDLRWMQQHCGRVAIVAHSQGAAIAHQVLKDGCHHQDKVRAFVTLGQGISKLHLLWRMDWDPQTYRAAWWSRVLVTTGMALAGLPALGLLARHWTDATVVTMLVRLPIVALLPCAGFVIILVGVHAAMRAVCGGLEQDLALPDAEFWWSDYYASADPVSNGPLISESSQIPRSRQAMPASPGLLPRPCNQVYNSASIFFDHNRYLRNQDQLLSQLINDLAAAAYGSDPSDPKVVREEDLKKVGHRRHRLIVWLIAARMLAVGLALGLWQANLGPVLRAPMNRLVALLSPHTVMGTGFARFVAASLITAVAYVAAIVVWRVRERYVVRRFFDSAEPVDGEARQDAHAPAHPAATAAGHISVG